MTPLKLVTPPKEEWDLFDLDVTEISSVTRGDNRGAKILMFKAAPGEEAPEETPPAIEQEDPSDDAVNRIVAETLVEELLNTTTTTTTTEARRMTRTMTMKKRGDVAAAVRESAAEIRKANPELTEAQALAKAWEDEDLAARYEELPADEAPATAPVRKGASTIAKVEAVAAEIRKADPKLTQAQAMSKAFEIRDDLADAYEVALRG